MPTEPPASDLAEDWAAAGSEYAGRDVDAPPPTRMRRPFFGRGPSWVLTRLHTRYDQQTLNDDLLFRTAPAVWGGRANWDGTLGDHGAQVQAGGSNNFQGRYIIRHYWEGKVTCDNPVYGRWGGRPGRAGTRAPWRRAVAMAVPKQPGIQRVHHAER